MVGGACCVCRLSVERACSGRLGHHVARRTAGTDAGQLRQLPGRPHQRDDDRTRRPLALSSQTHRYSTPHTHTVTNIHSGVTSLKNILTDPIMKPGLRYIVDFRIRTYTEPVLLKYGELATKCRWIYEYFLQCRIRFITMVGA